MTVRISDAAAHGVRILLIAALLALSCVTSRDVVRAEPAKGEEPITVALINPGYRGEVFWDMLIESMQGAARQLNFKLEVVYAEHNWRHMQAQGMAMLGRANPPQYLILANQENAAVPILEAAGAAGVRTLLISSDLLPQDRQRLGGPRERLKSWVGSMIPDTEASGARMAEQLLAEARRAGLYGSDGKLHLLVVTADTITPTGLDRRRGLERQLAKETDVVVDRVLYAHWNATEAEAVTAKYLAWADRAGVRVAGVWAGNDPMALGALKALRAAGLKPGKDVMVAGLNWSREAIEEVRDGAMVLTDGGHFLMGMWSIIMLRDLIDGCDPFQPGITIPYPTSAVVRDNAARVLSVLNTGGLGRVDVSRLRAKGADGACRAYDFAVEAFLNAVESPVPE